MHCVRIQLIPCSVKKWNPIECRGFYAARLNAVDSMKHDWMQWIYAAWPKASRLYAVESMQRCPVHPDWMQWIICSMAQNIPIKCSGFYAAWWNEVYSIQSEVMEHYCRQWILCSMIECSGFHEAWLNVVDSMQSGALYLDWMKWIPCSLV